MAFGLNQRQAAQQMSVASARKAIDVDRFCPEGVGAWLANDLARSVSKTCEAVHLTHRAV